MADEGDTRNSVGRIDFWGSRHVSPLELAQDAQGRRSLEEMRDFMQERSPKTKKGRRVKKVRVVRKGRQAATAK